MITLKQTVESELEQIVELEQQADVRDYIAPNTLDDHRSRMAEENTIYLTIHNEGEFAGFMILIHHPNTDSMECRRIAVIRRGKGIGQQALHLMEAYSQENFNVKRIRLDVFEFNERGKHVYTKLGYQQFKTGTYRDKTLLYMEKYLKVKG